MCHGHLPQEAHTFVSKHRGFILFFTSWQGEITTYGIVPVWYLFGHLSTLSPYIFLIGMTLVFQIVIVTNKPLDDVTYTMRYYYQTAVLSGEDQSCSNASRLKEGANSTMGTMYCSRPVTLSHTAIEYEGTQTSRQEHMHTVGPLITASTTDRQLLLVCTVAVLLDLLLPFKSRQRTVRLVQQHGET